MGKYAEVRESQSIKFKTEDCLNKILHTAFLVLINDIMLTKEYTA